MFDLKELARLLDGDVSGSQVVAPGPGHSRKDRSLSVRLSPSAPDGFIVFSHAGDDWRESRDYVRDRMDRPRRTTCPRAGRRKPADGCLSIGRGRKMTAGRSRFGGGASRLSGPLLSATCGRREAIMVRSLRRSVFSRLKGSIRLP